MTLLITAGSETISSLLLTLTYALCTHRHIHTRLAALVRTTFPDPSAITLQSLEPLVYLDACIKEALRLFPPVSANLPRQVPSTGAHIGPYFVPPGSIVSVAPWASVRSARNFHRPNEFRPERWLRGHPGEGWDSAFEHDEMGASMPFGAGPKQCIGQTLAYYEIRLVVAHLLWAFEFELEGEGALGEENRMWGCGPGSKHLRVYQTLDRPALWVKFREREGGAA